MKKSLFLTVLLITIMQAVNAQWLVHGTAPDYTPYYIGTNGIGGPGTVGTNQPLYFGVNDALYNKEAGYITDTTRNTGMGVNTLYTLSKMFPPVLIDSTFGGNVALGDTTI